MFLKSYLLLLGGVLMSEKNIHLDCENYEELVRMSEITKEKGDMMTEKRYTTMWKPETTFSRFWIVRENWERKLNANDVVDLLNEQHEQIERLKGNFRALDEVKCELADENEQLKQQKDKWKQQCIHFKEMLDDMDIAYLCDEWIYGELKGDVE